MKIGNELNYFGKIVKVIEFDKTHVVVRFESGTQICTNKRLFE